MNISALSDDELNKAMIWINTPLGFKIYRDYEVGSVCGNLIWKRASNYLTDWSLTGPFMLKYDCALLPRTGSGMGPLAQICVRSNNKPPYYEENSNYKYYESSNKNPLRAICECRLMIYLESKK